MKVIIILIAVLISQSLFAQSYRGEGLYDFIDRKQKQKKKSRWTLGGHMALRERNSLMDQWLAINTSANALEFFFSGEMNSGTIPVRKDTSTGLETNLPEETFQQFNLGIFVTIFGLEFQYKRAKAENQNSFDNTRTGMFHLRILGNSTQSTSINLSYGIKVAEDNSFGKFNYDFVGAWSEIYLIGSFGIQGMYRKYLNSENDDRTLESSGSRTEAGAFLEFNFFRLYGVWFQEDYDFTVKANGNETTFTNDGIFYGVKLFF